MPATAKFLQAVANLPQGAVVLPGLDTDLDDDAWQIDRRRQGRARASSRRRLPRTIRNIAMHALLQRFGIKRGDVEILGEAVAAAAARCWHPRRCGRRTRPRNGTIGWHEPDIAAKIAAGMDKSRRDRGRQIPRWRRWRSRSRCARRGISNKSAALVTPDRALARRVTAALGRWNLEFDDSGGDALMDTPAGIFARLAAEAAARGLEPPTLLALLKHPLFRLGGTQDALKRGIEVLELALLRGTRPQAGSSGLAPISRASAMNCASCAAAKPPRCTVPSRGRG